MFHTTRRAVGTVGALAAAATLLAGVPAQAGEAAPSRVTLHRDLGPFAAGEQFVLRGRLTSQGEPVPGATVRVKTFRDGDWVRLRGATVSTNDAGRYRVRVVLFQKGDRDLRVVADPAGEGVRAARAETVVSIR
jgi:hypothetical protein